MTTTMPLDWDDVPDVYFRIGPDNRWAVLSESFESMTGYRRRERLGIDCLHDVVPDDRGRAQRLLLDARDGAASAVRDVRGEFRLLTSRQSIVAVEAHVRQRWSEGRFTGARGILRDVSTARALQEAERDHGARTRPFPAAATDPATLAARLTGSTLSIDQLLSLCAWCKKVRSDDGGWQPIEDYFQDRLETQLSHGMCPECAERLTGQR